MQQQCSIDIQGQSYSLYRLAMTEALSQSTVARLEVLLPPQVELACLQQVSILLNHAGYERRIVGIITAFHRRYVPQGQLVHMTIEPRLILLQQQNAAKLWQQTATNRVVQQYLEQVYAPQQITISPACCNELIDQWLQLPMETDWQAWQRLLNTYQLQYWFETREQQEHLVMVDKHCMLPMSQLLCLQYVSAAMAVAQHRACGFDIKVKQILLPTPSHAILIKTREPHWQVGYQLQLDATQFNTAYSGTYVIKRIKHHLQQGLAASVRNYANDYYNELLLTPSDQALALVKAEPITLAFLPSIVWSDGEYPLLDQQGDYQVSLPFFKGHRTISAKRSLPKLADQQGVHFALPKQACVLVAWPNGCGAEAVMLAALPTEQQPSPVTKRNSQQAVCKTQSANLLLFDQQEQSPNLLVNNADYNIMHFTKTDKEPSIQLWSQGVVAFMAGLNWYYQLGGSEHLSAGDDVKIYASRCVRYNIAGELSVYMTGKMMSLAGQQMSWQVANEYSLKLKKQLLINANDGIQVSVDQSDAEVNVQQALALLSAKDIVISSDDSMTIHYVDGSITLNRTGEIDIVAKKVMMKSQHGVNWQGQLKFVSD